MSIITAEYNPAIMNPHRRASVRAELAEMFERVPADGVSATVTSQVLTTAINAIDAIDRIDELADHLADSNATPLGLIGRMIATEIRNALKGV